jgi:hypothetical protein
MIGDDLAGQDASRPRPASKRSRTSMSTPAGRRWSAWSIPQRVGIARNQRLNPMQGKSPMHLGRRCGARTRSGSRCRSPAMPNGRCRMHGGPSLARSASPQTREPDPKYIPPFDDGALPYRLTQNCEETGIYLQLMESMVRETFVSRAIRVGVVSNGCCAAQVPRPHSPQ